MRNRNAAKNSPWRWLRSHLTSSSRFNQWVKKQDREAQSSYSSARTGHKAGVPFYIAHCTRRKMSAPNGTKLMAKSLRTTRSRSRVKGKIPSLKDFVHKQTVIRQYRGFLRAVGTIPDNNWKGQCQEEVRKTFRLEQHEKDPLRISKKEKES